MTYFFQLVVTGLSLGMMYALVGISFVIIFKCSQAFNVASGQIVMLGGYIGYTFLIPLKLPVWAAIIASIAVAIVMGLVIERLALRPLLGQPALAVVMMTVALAGVLDGVAIMGWGGEYLTYHDSLPEISLQLGSVSVSPSSLLAIIVSVIIVAILIFVFRFTKIGLAMRATAEDEQVTRSLGIKATTVYALVWAIACVVGVIAGVLLGGVSGVSPPLVRDRAQGSGGGHPRRDGFDRWRHLRGDHPWHPGEPGGRLSRPADALRGRVGDRSSRSSSCSQCSSSSRTGCSGSSGSRGCSR